eukprot:5677037-Amphidinium_carterae.1
MAEALKALTAASGGSAGKSKGKGKTASTNLVEDVARLVIIHERKLAELDAALGLDIFIKSAEGKKTVESIRQAWD